MSNKKTINNKKGFTLIELVVVIAILAVLALILIPSITGYVNKANDAKHQANARSIYTAATLVESDPSFSYGEAADDAPAVFKTEVNKIVGSDVGDYTIKKNADGSFTVTITGVDVIYPK